MGELGPAGVGRDQPGVAVRDELTGQRTGRVVGVRSVPVEGERRQGSGRAPQGRAGQQHQQQHFDDGEHHQDSEPGEQGAGAGRAQRKGWQPEGQGGNHGSQEQPPRAAQPSVRQPGRDEAGEGGRVVQLFHARQPAGSGPRHPFLAAPHGREQLLPNVLGKWTLSGVAGILETRQGVEIVTGFDPDLADPGPGIDDEIDRQRQLRAGPGRQRRPALAGPRQLGVPVAGEHDDSSARAGRVGRDGGHEPGVVRQGG